MPLRFLRPGITTSRRWNSLDWDAQSFYIRLLTVVDDFGRYDADHELLKSFCFPLRRDVTLRAVANMCVQLAEAKLVEFYKDSEGKEYLQLTKWQERARSKSRFPGPNDNNCQQVFTTVDKCMLPSPSPSPSPSPFDESEIIYKEYPRKVGKPVALRAISKQIQKHGFERILDATKRFAAAWASATDFTYCPHPSTWFNQERFLDDPASWRPEKSGGVPQGPSIADKLFDKSIKEAMR